MNIRALYLKTAYLNTLAEFYSSILNLPVKAIDEKQICIPIGSSELLFEETKSLEPFYHFAITIPANKIAEAREWLASRVKLLWMEDYKSDVADFVSWHARSVYFYDPAGNVVELIARFDLDNGASEAFSSKQFLSVNEVGLVFKRDEFEQKTEELLKSYSLAYFSKQPPLPQFRAIGDDNGLFVVVPDQRTWYPTDKPAGVFPLKVIFQNEGHEFAGKYDCLNLEDA